MATPNDFVGLALQTGGAGIGVTGVCYALYLHFTNKFAKAEAKLLNDKLVRAEKETQATIKTLEADKLKALESAKRDSKIELANLQGQLNKQRLDTHGEFIDLLGNKIDKLTDNVLKLTADVSTVAAIQRTKD